MRYLQSKGVDLDKLILEFFDEETEISSRGEGFDRNSFLEPKLPEGMKIVRFDSYNDGGSMGGGWRGPREKHPHTVFVVDGPDGRLPLAILARVPGTSARERIRLTGFSPRLTSPRPK